MSVEIGARRPYHRGMSDVSELYERDFYAWTQDQAALLRAWPEALRPNALDLAHLAEEIEDLGRSQRGAIESLMTQVVEHLLKLRSHSDQASRRHWQKAIAGFRDQIDILFRDNPSLRARRAEIAATVWRRAARRFGQDLDIDGHDPRAALVWLPDPAEPYFDLDREVLAEGWFPPPLTA
jgi:hypothetical protein